MPSDQTHIFINRLYIVKGDSSVYDESFHPGVNIIRGENSSGKSTISDFIFFALGGNYTSWKPEASACDYVFLEISIDSAILTLKRQVTDSTQQPMNIFWGPLDDSLKSNVTGWSSFPFKRSSKKQSFSQVLFEALGFPEVRNDADSNITMHQLLRLIYVDQLSNVQSLLRDEPFDSPLTRQTIGDLLFGTYDDSIYLSRLELREAERKRDDVKEQIKHLVSVLNESEQETESASIDKNIAEKEDQLEKLYAAIKKYASEEKKTDDGKEVSEDIEEKKAVYLRNQAQLNDVRDRMLELSVEIQDSLRFVNTLKARVKALEEAEVARSSFSELHVSHCPVCLTNLGKHEDITKCQLCKNPISPDVKKSNMLRMKQELLFQIKESTSLLTSREEEYHGLERQIPELLEAIKISKLALEEELSRVRTVRNKKIDTLFLTRGQIERDLAFLQKQKKAVAVLEGLQNDLSGLTTRISQLQISINTKEAKQKERLGIAHSTIEQIASELLQADLPREEIFQSPGAITIDFSKNTFAVNDRNDFSASSIVYLKNSVHFAITFSSMEHDFFRYPRFILCDNIEDKGMEEERSHNFQKRIVEMSQNSQQPHQIIYTTSMIAPELEDTEFCVGEKYTQTNKSLKFD